jgi:hypothetical protein
MEERKVKKIRNMMLRVILLTEGRGNAWRILPDVDLSVCSCVQTLLLL